MTKTFLPSVLAGACITIGSAAYCASPTWGLFLFCAGLITICHKQYALFTGVVGYARSTKDWIRAAVILIGNLIGCACAGTVIRYASPQIATAANRYSRI